MTGHPELTVSRLRPSKKAVVEEFLLDIQGELLSGMYLPMRNRKKEIPKDNGKIPSLGNTMLYETE